jgi:hypothetical protein
MPKRKLTKNIIASSNFFKLCSKLLIAIPKAVFILLLSKTLKIGHFDGVGKPLVV